MQRDRASLVEEIRGLVGLPAWSNLRGDDVIDAIGALDLETQWRVLDLYIALRELDDAAELGKTQASASLAGRKCPESSQQQRIWAHQERLQAP